MNRPQPRTSKLAGLSPLTAPPSPKGDRCTRGSDTAKITVTLDRTLVEEARQAYWQTSHETGVRSFAAWVEAAMERYLETQRERFNHSEPFKPLEAGNIPTGKRVNL